MKLPIFLSGKLPRLEVRTVRIATFASLLVVFAIIAALTYLQITRSERTNQAIIGMIALRNDVDQVFLLAQGAETAQRGYLLTGQTKYLAPYERARTGLPVILARLAQAGDVLDQRDVGQLKASVGKRMAVLDRTIALRQQGRTRDAVNIIVSGLGYRLMAQIRGHAHSLELAQDQKLSGLRAARDTGLRFTFIVIAALLTTLILFLAISMSATLTVLRERDRSMRQLAAAKFEADEANRGKSEFLASMSHELRTPLNAILGFSEVIQTQMLGPVGSPLYREYAEHIHKSGQHLLDLINDVLDLSKINAGKMELREEEVAISSLVYDSLALVRGRADQVKLEELPTGNLPLIWADNRLLKQILVNLLSNAIKFTPVGGMVSIGAALSPSGISISVSDTGIGMSANEINKAMSEYGQVDSKVARDHQGTGLGLPICVSLAKLHGGELEIASLPGSGTTVTLALPASRILRQQIQVAS
jgi:signal transduction histidine kinase